MFENGGSQSVILSSISEILNNPQAVSDKIISQAKELLGNDAGSVQDELKINILLSQNGVEKTREIMVEKEYNQSLEVLEKNPEYQAAPPQEQEIARASARKAAQLNVTMRVEAVVNKGQKINDTQVQRLANSLNTPSQPSENTADQQSQSTSTNSANETVIVTGLREKNNLTDTTKKVLEGTLELTGKASENKYVQMGLAAYGTVKSLTPMGVIQTITAKAITAIAPNQVAAVAGKIDEVSTKASAVANGAISNNSATKYVNAYEAGKEDVSNKETNYYRTTGGKVVVNTAAATFVGSAVGIGAKSISKTVTKGKVDETIKNDEALESKQAYHYTAQKWGEAIKKDGLREGAYATPNGNLSGLGAKLELSLVPTRNAPDIKITIDLNAMRKDGLEIPKPTRVSNVVTDPKTGRTYTMPGGGWEMKFPYAVPPKYIKKVTPVK